MVWRTAFTVVWLAIETSLALYVGIGFAILLGYLFVIIVLLVPMNPTWVKSDLVKTVLGDWHTPDTELMLQGLSKSRSYRVTVAVTSVILLAVAIFALVALNFKLMDVLKARS